MKEIKSFEIVCCQELDEIKAPEKQVPLAVGEIRKNKSIKKEGGDAYGKRSSYLGKE